MRITLYLKGNKHAQVHNNHLQYLCPSNQTAPPAANSVPGQTDSTDVTDQSVSQTAPPAANNVPGQTDSTDVMDQNVSDNEHSKINN